MEVSPILRQARLGMGSRKPGPALSAPRPAASAAEPAVLPAMTPHTAEVAAAAPALPPDLLSEAEIEQRAIQLARQLLAAERDAAREEGMKAGYAEGLSKAKDEDAARAVRFDSEFSAVRDALMLSLQSERHEVEAAALELAMAAVVRLLGEAPDASRLQAHVRSASLALRAGGAVTVVMSPRDIRVLEQAGVVPAALAPHLAPVRWLADPGVQGGCILRTEAGELDARIARQVEMLGALLNQVYLARPPADGAGA